MKPTRYLWLLLWGAALVALSSGAAYGSDIKARMKARLPALIDLKAAGIIGETHQGFLAYVGSEKKEEALVEAENQDRRRVYEAIARQQGTTPELVGQRRALQIAEMAKPGEWLQDAGGKWHQK